MTNQKVGNHLKLHEIGVLIGHDWLSKPTFLSQWLEEPDVHDADVLYHINVLNE